MTISELCIRRPVMTLLLSLAAILAGTVAYFQMPVAAIPRVDFPVITVSATFPGASPETMANSVALPLEREFSTIAGIDQMSSISGQGTLQITLQFVLGRPIDAAALDVQSALSRAQRRLPAEMTTPPSFRKTNPADAPVVLLNLRGGDVPLYRLNEIAAVIISPALSRIPGVAQVLTYGEQKYAVRVQLDPDRVAALGFGFDEAQRAIAAANGNTPVGTLDGPRQALTLRANDQLQDAAEFQRLVIGGRPNAPIRVQDVARVEDGVENNRQAAWLNGTRGLTLAVQRQPDANTVQVVDGVLAAIPGLSAALPPGAEVTVMLDRSVSIRHAVSDVQHHLLIAIGLVVLVIFLFLRKISATIIPGIAVPLSLAATFGLMYALGYGIDNITLLGLTLAVGLVVDDAIVMLEAIVRHMEEGMAPMAAAIRGAKEVGFTIISITLSLIAVFLPILLMGGVVGRVFNAFAATVSLAVLCSCVVSLTLTPLMASRLPAHSKPSRFDAFLERGFRAVEGGYAWLLDLSLRWRSVVWLAFVVSVGLSVWLAVIIPKGFFPVEDTGLVSVSTEGPQDTSFEDMAARHTRVADIIRQNPAVELVNASIGGGTGNASNQGRMFVQLKPREERPAVTEVLQQLRRQTAGIPGMRVYLNPIQNLNFGARQSRTLYQYTLQGLRADELYSWAERMQATLRRLPGLQDVNTDLQLNAPILSVNVDRDRAASLGVSVDQVRQALYSAFGARQISTIFGASDSYSVILEALPRDQQDEAGLSKIYLRSSTGRLVPLAGIANLTRTVGPLTVAHQGQLPAVTIGFNTAPGVALGQATNAISAAEKELGLPPTIVSGYAGTAQIFQQALTGQGMLLIAAVLIVYVVLGVLYESLVHPLTILSGLPAATVGALATLWLFDLDLSVIAIIGVLLLIGLVKKNAIMVVDVALERQRAGDDPLTAVRHASVVRFRPIMMTTLAAAAGIVPIAAGWGTAAELRQPLGLAVLGGLAVSQALTLFVTPVLFLAFEGLSRRFTRQRPAAAAAQPAE
ncbi:efflux RND transporter permease subunit [Roseomonas haemaphysalidis]|uniref:Efflux RND transporter permease subunit n=1 Tax=Roseomonas haemaphysalidis TaxID=2768162 RepID=A0ABS3KNZ2_9PROT|nr:efflux RND transporter permease subunit [Roseomonas haemaphysalidis]MBO1079155.1 efflux RND transporter permease subunit [Roseomonas haemaphysalidis]